MTDDKRPLVSAGFDDFGPEWILMSSGESARDAVATLLCFLGPLANQSSSFILFLGVLKCANVAAGMEDGVVNRSNRLSKIDGRDGSTTRLRTQPLGHQKRDRHGAIARAGDMSMVGAFTLIIRIVVDEVECRSLEFR
jgi:hypothetical protein